MIPSPPSPREQYQRAMKEVRPRSECGRVIPEWRLDLAVGFRYLWRAVRGLVGVK